MRDAHDSLVAQLSTVVEGLHSGVCPEVSGLLGKYIDLKRERPFSPAQEPLCYDLITSVSSVKRLKKAACILRRCKSRARDIKNNRVEWQV